VSRVRPGLALERISPQWRKLLQTGGFLVVPPALQNPQHGWSIQKPALKGFFHPGAVRWQKWTPGRHRCLPSSTIASKIYSCHVSERSSPPAMELIALRMASLRRTSRSAWMWGSIFCESGSSAPVQIRVRRRFVLQALALDGFAHPHVWIRPPSSQCVHILRSQLDGLQPDRPTSRAKNHDRLSAKRPIKDAVPPTCFRGREIQKHQIGALLAQLSHGSGQRPALRSSISRAWSQFLSNRACEYGRRCRKTQKAIFSFTAPRLSPNINCRILLVMINFYRKLILFITIQAKEIITRFAIPQEMMDGKKNLLKQRADML